jgi:hypothetical protein
MVSKSELDQMKVAGLRQLCRTRNITGYSKLKRADLIQLILEELGESERSSESKVTGCSLPDNCASNEHFSDQDIRNIASSCGIQARDPDTGMIMSREELCSAISAALTKPVSKALTKPVSKGCSKFRQKKAPKCEDQPGCDWVKGKGCIRTSETTSEPDQPVPSSDRKKPRNAKTNLDVTGSKGKAVFLLLKQRIPKNIQKNQNVLPAILRIF